MTAYLCTEEELDTWPRVGRGTHSARQILEAFFFLVSFAKNDREK